MQLSSHSRTFSQENVLAKFILQTVRVDSCKSLTSPFCPSPLILFNDQEVRFSSNLRRCVGAYLFSRAVASQVSSARQSLTSVFGMGTGGPSALITPTILTMSYHRNLLNYISGMLIKNQTRECTQQLRSFDRLRSFNRFKNHL